MPFGFATRLLLSAALLSGLPGCRGASRPAETTGAEALIDLPTEVASLMPEGAILCFQEAAQDGDYRLWIFRKPEGRKIDFPKKTRGRESHERPASALMNLLATRLPDLELGGQAESRCRFTHWTLADGAEIQIRELIAGGEWVASVERISF